MAKLQLKTGDRVHIEPMTGFGDPSVRRVTSVQKRYREKTGKPYEVISVSGHLFDGDTLNAITSPTAYYISGKVAKKTRKDVKGTTVSGDKYNIVRYYKKSGRKKIIHRNVSLSVARLHCNDPRTSKAGVWFDGYTKVK